MDTDSLRKKRRLSFHWDPFFHHFIVISETVGQIKYELEESLCACDRKRELVCLKYIDKGGGASVRKEHFSLMRPAARLHVHVSHVSGTHIRPKYFINVMFISSRVYLQPWLCIDSGQPF